MMTLIYYPYDIIPYIFVDENIIFAYTNSTHRYITSVSRGGDVQVGGAKERTWHEPERVSRESESNVICQ